ncbi:MAG: hypothetical protein JWN36_853 [Microbacteriaceae bacterium]|nr:hypothetical protein [Microbacteriaceae bacterium]
MAFRLTDAQTSQRRVPPTALLGASGLLLVVGGLVGGLLAKHAADVVSHAKSAATRLIEDDTVSDKQMIGLTFDPSSAHYVPPDYTGFWIGMLVVALGLLALATTAGIRLVRMRNR